MRSSLAAAACPTTMLVISDLGCSSHCMQACQNIRCIACVATACRFPKLIHQTVKNKSHVSCQEQEVITLWKQLNPGYTHTLYDDSDIRAFVEQHYPQLVPMPFNYFLTGVERADLFRVLVVHKV